MISDILKKSQLNFIDKTEYFRFLSQDFNYCFLKGISSMLIRIKYEYGVKHKLKIYEENPNPTEISIENFSDHSQSEEFQILTEKKSEINPLFEAETTLLHITSRYLAKLSALGDTFVYETDVGVFKIEKKNAKDINGTIYNLASGYSVEFSHDLFVGAKVAEISNLEAIVSDFSTEKASILSIIWKNSPLQLNLIENNVFESKLVSLFFVDSFQNEILTDSKTMKINIPLYIFNNKAKIYER